MGDEEYVDEEEYVDVDSIDDEQTLIDMLDEAEDFDERKRIRDRLRKVQYELKAQRAEMMRRREEERDLAVKKRLQAADEQKKRTLAMYDQMAKSAPAGGQKVMDVNVYKYNDAASSSPSSPTPGEGGKKRDLVEEAIRQRVQQADDRKKRILAAYDAAAKSAPAGADKIVNFDAFKRADVSDFTPSTPVGSATFGMSGGVPKVVKGVGSVPGTPMTPGMGAPNFPKSEDHLDPMERAIRARQREAEERKKRTLAAYDIIAKSGGAGPKVVVLEEFRDLKVTPDMKLGSNYDPTASFRGGVLQAATTEPPRQLSARARFQQMDAAEMRQRGFQPNSRFRSAPDAKAIILDWCRRKTNGYQHINIQNYSTSWNDGMAFCALIHHFFPDAFDYWSLDPRNRSYNFQLAFYVAYERGGIYPLLDVEDMVALRKPDWKSVFTYIQSLYRELHDRD